MSIICELPKNSREAYQFRLELEPELEIDEIGPQAPELLADFSRGGPVHIAEVVRRVMAALEGEYQKGRLYEKQK